MAQWYVKDLSKLTGVSVQTLHHYDRIGLLKPSIRLSNGYRVYSEKDLLKLQRIIALKFFGFELSRIKELLIKNDEVTDHFLAQAKFLEEKAKTLLEASKTLKSITSEYKQNKSIPWETVIKIIEVYRMTQELEKTWAGNVFTPEELKQYAAFEAELKTRYTPEEKKSFDETWANLLAQVASNLDKDPKSETGSEIAKQVMDLINGIYGKENANLKHSIWHKGFKQGKMEGERYVDPAVISWLDKAIDSYYRKRIYAILDQVGPHTPADLAKKWNALMEEMLGDSEIHKQEIITVAMTDEGVSPAAREWLKQLSKI